MEFPFNVCEVFEIAEAIERNGAKFYQKVAEKFEDARVRKTLLELADWEAGHADCFATIRKNLSERECPPTAFDPDGEDALYLRAMADDHVFDVRTDPREKLTGKESCEEILQMAAALEKEALAFYMGLKAAVPTKAGREKVDVIIKSKMRHIGMLNQELVALKGEKGGEGESRGQGR